MHEIAWKLNGGREPGRLCHVLDIDNIIWTWFLPNDGGHTSMCKLTGVLPSCTSRECIICVGEPNVIKNYVHEMSSMSNTWQKSCNIIIHSLMIHWQGPQEQALLLATGTDVNRTSSLPLVTGWNIHQWPEEISSIEVATEINTTKL